MFIYKGSNSKENWQKHQFPTSTLTKVYKSRSFIRKEITFLRLQKKKTDYILSGTEKGKRHSELGNRGVTC